MTPTDARRFNGGYDASTFCAEEHPSYQMTSIVQCRRCSEAMPCGLSPREYQFIEVGFTATGVQAWCKRCESEVFTIDFAGAAPKRVEPNRYTLDANASGEPMPRACECEACSAARSSGALHRCRSTG